MASGADDNDAAPAKAGANAAASSVKRDDEPVPSPWRDVPSAADACMPVLGVAELWPELSRGVAAAKGKKAPAASSSTAAAAASPKPIAALREQQAATNEQVCDAPPSQHGDRTIVSAAGVQPSPTNAQNNRERRAAAPEQPPTHASSHRSSNTGVRGHHQSERFMPHPHGRGREGFNGGGSRRPAGGANSRGGNVNANGSNTYRSRGGGGGRHGQEHRGGFNGQPRGRGHEDGHMPLGRPPAGYVQAPHHMHPPPLPPPFMPMVMPPAYPYYHGLPVGYGPYGYGYPEFVTGYFPFIPEGLPPFMPYAAPPNHMMHTNLEQEAGPSQTELPQQQQPMQAQQAPPDQILQQQNPEQMRQEIRQQIEYYFSDINLENDTFLREQMDEQGWVPLTLIAGFKKIFSKTTDMEFILDSILPSIEVEVLDGRKIRKRVGWEVYSLP